MNCTSATSYEYSGIVLADMWSHGEGSVFQRKNGTWVAQVSVEDQAGRIRHKQARAHTQGEALQKLEGLKRDRECGRTHVPERLTVERFLDTWLAEHVERTLKLKTRIEYSRIVETHLKPSLGGTPLKKLRPEDVQYMVNGIYDEGHQRTAQFVRSVLQSALKLAHRWRYLDVNVASLVAVPRVNKKLIQSLDPDQAGHFLRGVKGDRLEALYVVAVTIGIREGEAFALKWEAVDLEHGTLFVRHTLHRSKGGWSLESPKTERSRRTIHLPQVCLGALVAHRTRREMERAVAGERWHEHGFVFTTSIGTPLDGPNVLKRPHGILSRASLPAIRFHDLRHTCATLLLIQGVDPRRVMELLGHSSIAVTLNVYGHVLAAQKRETAMQMEAILNPIADKTTDRDASLLVN